MIKILSIILCIGTNCWAGTYTSNLSLYKPAKGDTNYVTPFATGMDTLDASIPDKRITKSANIYAAWTYYSTATYVSPPTFTAVATSTPSVTNAIYKQNMIGAWLNYNGVAGSITSSFNIAAVVKISTGDYTVYFANDFASTAYICLCSTGRAEADDYGDCVVQGGPANAGSISVATYNDATTRTDRARLFLLCVGAQ